MINEELKLTTNLKPKQSNMGSIRSIEYNYGNYKLK